MKIFFHILVLAAITLFFACSPEVKKEETPTKDTLQTTVPEQPLNPEPVAQAPATTMLEKYSCWKGALTPNNIQLGLWISKKEDLLIGEVTYTKSGIPIKVAGKKDEDYYTLYEFDKDGTITGVFSFQSFGDSLKGHWYSPKKGKGYEFGSSKAPSVRVVDQDSLFIPKPAPLGKYRFSFGQEGGHGHFTCREVFQGAVFLDLTAVSPAPAFHMAIIEDTVDFDLPNNASVLEYSSNEGGCRINITFFDTFASIDYVDKKSECDFGYNAHPTGIYSRVK
ncbi:MAG: hypothetical protein ACJ75J_05325 [Cytophagaceae bacterium]